MSDQLKERLSPPDLDRRFALCRQKLHMSALAAQHHFQTYHCDDYFEAHKGRIDPALQPHFHQITQRTWEQTWMRPPTEMAREEEAIYREEFPMILDDLLALDQTPPILAEGSALLPDLVFDLIEDRRRAVWVVPTASFLRNHYRRRGPWVEDILNQCQDPEQAYHNWMARDALFASTVASQARELSLEVLVVDGEHSIEQERRHYQPHTFPVR